MSSLFSFWDDRSLEVVHPSEGPPLGREVVSVLAFIFVSGSSQSLVFTAVKTSHEPLSGEGRVGGVGDPSWLAVLTGQSHTERQGSLALLTQSRECGGIRLAHPVRVALFFEGLHCVHLSQAG